MSNEKLSRIHPTIRQRARKLRQPQTSAEEQLWQHLRRKQLEGYYFRRQHPIGNFIVDFYCAEVRLVIEVDGDVHAFQVRYDTARTEWLIEHGYHLLRFTNDEIFRQLKAVLEHILTVCDMLQSQKRPGDDLQVQRAVAAQNAFSQVTSGKGEDSTVEVRYWRETHDTAEIP
jgi:very-short-patch-repair endonuclease